MVSRKVMRDHLTRKKRRLQQQGARLIEIKNALGAVNFAGMSDKQLTKLYNRSKAQGNLKVINRNVYTTSYIKKAKAWYQEKYNVDMLTDFKGSQASYVNKNFKSLEEIKEHKKNVSRQARENYIDLYEKSLEKSFENRRMTRRDKMLAKKTVSRIRNMSETKWKKLHNSNFSSLISFDRIINYIQTDNSKIDYEIDEQGDEVPGLVSHYVLNM